jgi:hypothetical protein
MSLVIPCVRCGKVFAIAEQLAGRKIRCQACGQIQRIPTLPRRSATGSLQPESDIYSLAPESPALTPARTPEIPGSMRKTRGTTLRKSRGNDWRGLVRAGVGEASRLELENLVLIALSAADLLVTYALLQRGPAFYESNPVAQWFFVRWNIAGMAIFKFSAMGLVVVIGEIVERHRPGWGRGLLLMSSLATAAVVVHGLRLLFGHGDNGAPL